MLLGFNTYNGLRPDGEVHRKTRTENDVDVAYEEAKHNQDGNVEHPACNEQLEETDPLTRYGHNRSTVTDSCLLRGHIGRHLKF